jgi:hypothetical protein
MALLHSNLPMLAAIDYILRNSISQLDTSVFNQFQSISSHLTSQLLQLGFYCLPSGNTLVDTLLS